MGGRVKLFLTSHIEDSSSHKRQRSDAQRVSLEKRGIEDEKIESSADRGAEQIIVA